MVDLGFEMGRNQDGSDSHHGLGCAGRHDTLVGQLSSRNALEVETNGTCVGEGTGALAGYSGQY